MDGSAATKNADSSLDDVIRRLAAAKKQIDTDSPHGLVSWADLIALAGRMAVSKEWRELKSARAADAAGAEIINTAYGTDWPIIIGRVDKEQLDGEGNKVPSADASVGEIKDFFARLNNKTPENINNDSNPFQSKPYWNSEKSFLLWCAASQDSEAEEKRWAAFNDRLAEIKLNFDRSRQTVTRTTYEVRFVAAYEDMALVGATLDKFKYVYPVEKQVRI